MCDIKKYSEDLTASIVDSDLSSIPADILEISIDQCINEGFLQDIPVVKAIVGLFKTGRNIKDLLFFNKLIKFLSNLKDVDVDKRRKMVAQIDGSGEYQLKVGEKLLYILDRCEDHEKAGYIARLFKCFINEKINYFYFNIIVDLINNMPTVILHSFLSVDIEAPNKIKREMAELYIRYGLMYSAVHVLHLAEDGKIEEDNGAELTGVAKIVHKLLNG